MKTAFALYEVHKFEGAHLVALFSSSIAAKKSGLELKRKMVKQALDDYRLGIKEAEWTYRNCWKNVKLTVEEEIIHE